MIWLLDTNVISQAARNPNGAAAQRIAAAEADRLVTSVVVAAELRFGYLRVGSQRIRDATEALVGSFEVLDWGEACTWTYGQLRADLERRGQPIGTMDMLIAAHALTLDAILVTDNDREFGRVPGLKIENWVR